MLVEDRPQELPPVQSEGQVEGREGEREAEQAEVRQC